MFNWLIRLFGRGEKKRTAEYQEKQRSGIGNEKSKCDATQKGVAFFIRVNRRRAKKLMCINTNRKKRGLFAYV